MEFSGSERSKDEREAFTGKWIEKRARALLDESEESLWLPQPDSVFRRELALLLYQLDKTRRLEGVLQKDLLEQECFVRTELHGVEARTPRYSPYRFPEREKLQRQLNAIRTERRRTMLTLEERTRNLQRSLLAAMEKQFQLRLDEDED